MDKIDGRNSFPFVKMSNIDNIKTPKKKKKIKGEVINYGLAMVRAEMEENTFLKAPSTLSERTPSPVASTSKCSEESAKYSEEPDDSTDIIRLSRQIDETLEHKAIEHNLSAINVKCILKHMIKYPSVISMLLGVDDNSDIASNLKFTRARAKELIKKGNFDWPSTPMKEPVVKARTFLDIDYTNEEDDVDYDPQDDNNDESDEDEEMSVPNTPVTSNTHRSPNTHDSPNTNHSLTTMPPPQTNVVLKKSIHKDKKKANQDSPIDTPTCLQTRSRVTLADFAAEEWEEQLNLVDPDAAQLPDELIHNPGPQQDLYFQFLSNLNTENIDKLLSLDDDEDTNEDDPEYNFQEDIDNPETPSDCVDEIRMDKSVRVPKREVHDLMLDLADIWAGNEDTPSPVPVIEPTKTRKIMATTSCQTENSSLQHPDKNRINVLLLANVGGFEPESLTQLLETVNNYGSDRLLNDDGTTRRVLFTLHESELLKQQMRMHIQLLVQSFILSRPEGDEFKNVTNDSKQMLEELDQLTSEHKAKLAIWSPYQRSTSYFDVENLGPALELIHGPPPNITSFDDDEKPISVGFNKSKFGMKTQRLRRSVCTLLCASTAIIYPQLIPLSGPQKRKMDRSRPSFTESEDFLIAMGYAQFKNHPFYLEIIHNHMLPIKWPNEIATRWRVQRSSKIDPPNPIRYMRYTGNPPDTCSDLFQCTQTVPIQWPRPVCPPWLQRIQERGLRCLTEPGLLQKKPGTRWVKNIEHVGKSAYIRLDLAVRGKKKARKRRASCMSEDMIVDIVGDDSPKPPPVSVDYDGVEITLLTTKTPEGGQGKVDTTSGINEDAQAFLEAIHLLSLPQHDSPVKNTSAQNMPVEYSGGMQGPSHIPSPLNQSVDVVVGIPETRKATTPRLNKVTRKSVGLSSRKLKSPKKKAMEFLLEQGVKRVHCPELQNVAQTNQTTIQAPLPRMIYGPCAVPSPSLPNPNTSSSGQRSSPSPSLPNPNPNTSSSGQRSSSNLRAVIEDPSKKRKRNKNKNKAQKEKEALEHMLRPPSPKSTSGLCTQFVKDLKTGLFMHESKSAGLSQMLANQTDQDTIPTDMYGDMSELLLSHPHAKPLLVRLLGLFLDSGDCLKLGPEKFVTTFRAASSVLVKIERYLSSARSRANCRHILRTMKRLGTLQDPQPLITFFQEEFGTDPELLSELQVLFPSAPCDHRDMNPDQFEDLRMPGGDVDSQWKEDHFEVQDMMGAVCELEGQGTDMLREVVYDVFGNSRFSFNEDSHLTVDKPHSHVSSSVFLKGAQGKELMLNENKPVRSPTPWTELEDKTLIEILFDECGGVLSNAVNMAENRLPQRYRHEIFRRYNIHLSLFKQSSAESTVSKV